MEDGADGGEKRCQKEDDDWVRYSDDRFKLIERKLRDSQDLLPALKVDRDMREGQKRRGRK